MPGPHPSQGLLKLVQPSRPFPSLTCKSVFVYFLGGGEGMFLLSKKYSEKKSDFRRTTVAGVEHSSPFHQ